MMSMNERQRLIKILELLNEEEEIEKRKIDVSNRLRDQQGRFLPSQSESKTKEESPSRSIKLVKVKGSYGTYMVKEQWLSEEEKGRLMALGVIILLAIIF
ncbi:MAG TPA: hypothetical protein VNS08_17880 [Ureibacillus sp.]|nr:hypothetical protein [Ureibacillus sp.]